MSYEMEKELEMGNKGRTKPQIYYIMEKLEVERKNDNFLPSPKKNKKKVKKVGGGGKE